MGRLFERLLSRVFERQVLVPVLFLAAVWLGMSLGTNFYLRWVESRYDALFSRNLASMQASALLSHLAADFAASWHESRVMGAELRQRWDGTLGERLRLESLLGNAGDEDEPGVSADRDVIQDLLSGLEQLVLREGVRGSVERLQDQQQTGEFSELSGRAVSLALDLSIRNAGVLQSQRQALEILHYRVMLVRMLVLLLGLPVGVSLGWRVARRLESEVSQIAVTLGDTESLSDSRQMEFRITRQSRFEDVQRQAERVVDRLRYFASELQSVRQEVIQSERLAAVGELAAGVAHELRNPLTSVKLLLQHAAKRGGELQLSGEQGALILGEIRRMESTIQGLLDFSRTPVLHRVSHDLRTTLQRSMNLVEGRLVQSGIRLEVQMGDEPLLVYADSEQLNQVFVNLLLNAAEAMPGGGLVTVCLAGSEDCSVARVEILDTGPGISPEIQGRLFEPFATTKERGTGLGLAICRRIVRDHAGQIQADNRPDGGALFRVELPLTDSLCGL
ncbi:MAG: sensor histidine kinase [Planctomyces sp.]